MSECKQYTITLSGPHLVSGLIAELNYWGVRHTSYTYNGAVFTTQTKNVVDVVTECFRDYPHLVKIESHTVDK